MRSLLRLAVTTIAIYAAVRLLPGLYFDGPWWQLALVALILGLANALVRPILKLLTFPLIILTLGLFSLIINAVLLLLTARVAEAFSLDFRVADFWSAFLASLIITVASAVLNLVIGEDTDERSGR